MNAEDMAHWLEPSPPIAIDGTEREAAAQDGVRHMTRVRDLRSRFGDPEIYIPECSCGWLGERHAGQLGDRAARRQGLEHAESQLPPYGYRGRPPASR